MKKGLFVLLLASICCLPINASHRKNAVPDSVTSAKTIYVINETEFESVGDTAYEELGKWSHYQVVHDRKSADLILHFFEVSHTNVMGGNGQSTYRVNMFVTTSNSDDRLFQAGKLALSASGMTRKDVDEFEKWVDGK